MFLPARGSPTLVQALPGPSVQVTAGSNHTAVLLVDGQVFTFGSFSVRKTSPMIQRVINCFSGRHRIPAEIQNIIIYPPSDDGSSCSLK